MEFVESGGGEVSRTARSGDCVQIGTVSTPVTALILSVSVTLQLTVSQSVSLGVEPNLGLLTRDLIIIS
jgi:hypothetical protein